MHWILARHQMRVEKKSRTVADNERDELIAVLRDQVRAIDDLVLSNNRILDELIGQRQLQPNEESAAPATYLNGQPR